MSIKMNRIVKVMDVAFVFIKIFLSSLASI